MTMEKKNHLTTTKKKSRNGSKTEREIFAM